MHDILIRGATVYDGLGGSFSGDVAVRDGKIAETGNVKASFGIAPCPAPQRRHGRQSLDARHAFRGTDGEDAIPRARSDGCGAIGFASSFSPNHAGWQGAPMPSTVAADSELFSLVEPLRDKKRGIFVMATGPRATPEYMESISEKTGRPAFMVTVLTMYNDA